ncbi:PREDICTED: sodium channel protein Nach-like [Eufriesea mexicana]|uniref:sodium channel protein Nach-like n=1 Tax=Eufriesea mexicana TaxID=516756 RepID=UPI00083C41BA|nr:PREDICTED: sodium channel protein Nach-like [Eufriesea mexicana]
MTKRFSRENQDLLYYNRRYNDAISNRRMGKINVINVKSNIGENPIDTTKQEDTVPTLRDILNDYLESTSVHGLQYFGKLSVEVGFFGKILWTCTILISFVCLSLMVMQFLTRYNENPTNTYIKTFDAPIFQAPFPAVTICPVMPIPLQKRLAILENIILPQNVSRDIAMYLLKYGHHITHPYVNREFKYVNELKALLDINKWSVTKFLETLIPCEDIFESCWWSGERIDCTKSIKTSYSSYGLCCSFNYLLENYVGSQKGHPQPKPLSSADFGLWSGLKLVINKDALVLSENMINSSRIINSYGIMVLIHHRMDFPGLNTNMYMLQANHELEIAVKPQLIHKPGGLQHRNKENELVPVCIRQNESPLEYFSIYRYSNCYANCRIKAMIQLCGCLPFIYDYVAEFYNITRCEIERLHCIQENAKQIGIVRDVQNENITCSCRTPCENMNYDGFPNSIALVQTSSPRNVSDQAAVIKVYMQSQIFQILVTLSAADETYLLASVGGIFSLFLGCRLLRGRVETQPQQTSDKNFVNYRRQVY